MLENLGNIEKRVYRAFWDDGLLDVFASFGVLAIGFFWMRDWAAAAAIVPALLVPLWSPTRKRFVEPRIGMVEFSDNRERQNTRRLKLVIYAGIASLIIGLELYFFRDRLEVSPAVSLIAGLPALLLGLMALITSFLVASNRFLIYAAILVFAGVYGAMNDWRPGPILALAGIGMLLLATTVMVKFMKDNPHVPEDIE
ncbi:MAG: hypothetical protein OER91_11920 [Gammaproteobacteria bacterium]|nr:hypothetical protein [Gammaproteobacteria bacterium]